MPSYGARVALRPGPIPDAWFPSGRTLANAVVRGTADDDLAVAVVEFRAWARRNDVQRASFGPVFAAWLPHRAEPDWIPSTRKD